MHRDSAFPSARQSPEKTFGTQWDRLARHPSIMAGLRLKGKAVKAFSETIADEIEVVEQLTSYLARYPRLAGSLKISQENGKLDRDALQRAARSWLFVRLHPEKQ